MARPDDYPEEFEVTVLLDSAGGASIRAVPVGKGDVRALFTVGAPLEPHSSLSSTKAIITETGARKLICRTRGDRALQAEAEFIVEVRRVR